MAKQQEKSWLKEIVIGIVVAVAAAVIVSRLGLDKTSGDSARPVANSKSKSNPSNPPIVNAVPAAKGIVGRWEVVGTADGQPAHADFAGKHIRFNQNGTFTANIPFFMTQDGKYNVISNRAMAIDVPGVLYGRNKSELRYNLLDSEALQIDFEVLLGSVRFKRLD